MRSTCLEGAGYFGGICWLIYEACFKLKKLRCAVHNGHAYAIAINWGMSQDNSECALYVSEQLECIELHVEVDAN